MDDIGVLTLTAASLGFLHTLFGPDHYLPFIMIGRARRWSLVRISLLTLVCGLGHVGGSVVLGLAGVALGISLGRLESIEAVRGSLAAWLLIGFGAAYCAWGIYRILTHKHHSHLHIHGGEAHRHDHEHDGGHGHVHQEKGSVTPWVLFTIFVLGPCEPLIPLLMFPAAKSSLSGLLLVTGVFCLTTVVTMIVLVLVVSWGMFSVPLGKLEKYTHAVAGGLILASGLAIQLLGL